LAKGLLAETHNNLAGSATELNHPREAMEHFVKYNEMLEEEHRGSPNVSDARLTSSCFNIGMSFSMLSQYEKAVEWLKKALAEAERLSEPRKVKLARSLALINLGMTYWFSEIRRVP
jgi:tetratricopeptide (TPR) repeat protein